MIFVIICSFLKILTSGRLANPLLSTLHVLHFRMYVFDHLFQCIQVDEIVIFDDSSQLLAATTDGKYSGIGKKGNSCVQMARVLQYLECPQYLRKSFFPKHPDLQFAGLLNPLDCPHHLRKDDHLPFREGVVLNMPGKSDDSCVVNCGTRKTIQIDKKIDPDLRVTVRMPKKKSKVKNQGTVVSPDTPRTERGLYWGYTVRLASCLNKAISDCPFKDTEKYDLTIGTSERGRCVDDALLPSFKHALVVFGGVQGLEAALESDESIMGVDNPKSLFDFYFNTCPNQGSRTIRTEEALLITMSSLRPKLTKSQT